MTSLAKNLLTRIFRRNTTRPAPAANRFRPSMIALEDRTVPAADMFANATVLTGSFVTTTGNSVAATGEPGEFSLADGDVRSVWWQWTAPADGSVEINTYGSDFDAVLGIYVSAVPGVPTIDDIELLVNGDDEGMTFQSQLFFDAVAGTTYYITVDGWPNFFLDEPTGSGNTVLNLGMTPANDDFANATVVSGGTVTGHNLASTSELGEPVHPYNSEPINTVWWEWTAATSGPAEVNSFGSSFDTSLALYTGSSLGALTLIAANDDADDPNDDADSGFQSRVPFNAIAGTTYYIALEGFLNETGTITLNFPEAPPIGNNPPVTAAQSFSVAENSPGGTVVGTVVASDPDDDQLNYAITAGNTGGAFSINFTSGLIQVADGTAIDLETNPTFHLTVQVTDNGDPALSSFATVTISLYDANDAPVLDNSGSMSLGSIGQSAVNNSGTLVSQIIASGGGDRITDQDAGAVEGIAVVATDSTNGTWQYSTDAGATWNNFGAVSHTSARLLAADANTRVRFVPNAGFSAGNPFIDTGI